LKVEDFLCYQFKLPVISWLGSGKRPVWFLSAMFIYRSHVKRSWSGARIWYDRCTPGFFVILLLKWTIKLHGFERVLLTWRQTFWRFNYSLMMMRLIKRFYLYIFYWVKPQRGKNPVVALYNFLHDYVVLQDLNFPVTKLGKWLRYSQWD